MRKKPASDEDDRWLEELTLTDMERRSLEELEKWYITHNVKTNRVLSGLKTNHDEDHQPPCVPN